MALYDAPFNLAEKAVGLDKANRRRAGQVATTPILSKDNFVNKPMEVTVKTGSPQTTQFTKWKLPEADVGATNYGPTISPVEDTHWKNPKYILEHVNK